MTKERVLEALETYQVVLGGSDPVRHESDNLRPHEQVQHLHWMVLEAKKFIEEGRIEKAMRWLGFLQGALWAFKMRTIEEMKKDNMPKDEAFDRKRV